MFVDPSELTIGQLCRLASNRELVILTDQQLARLVYWSPDPTRGKARVQRLDSGKQWTIKKHRVARVQINSKVARELGLLPQLS